MKCKSQFLFVALMAVAMNASAFIESDASNRIGFYNAEGKPITFGFDAQGRVTAITNAIGKVIRYQYDVNGNLIQRTDAREQTTACQYSSMNRLTNSLIRVHSRTFAITNSYDLNGNRTNIVYPGGISVGYAYDAENRLSGLSVFAPSAPLREFSFSYDGASRLTNISYPNSVHSTFGYDAESCVTSLSHGSFINRVITRYYSASLRRFLSIDPSGIDSFPNLYAYSDMNRLMVSTQCVYSVFRGSIL